MPASIHRPEHVVLRRRLRELREAAGWTQARLSTALGRPQSYVSDIERGVRRVDVLELRDICLALDKSVMRFLEGMEQELQALGNVRRR